MYTDEIMKLNKIPLVFLSVSIVVVSLVSCNTSGKPENGNVQTVDVNDLQLSQVVHDTLSSEQIEKIKRIQTAFSEVNTSTLEQTITDFKRDRNPDNEIEIWLAMANAYQRFTSKNMTLGLNKKKEAYKLVLVRSMESEANARVKSDLKLLTDKEISEILSYYNLEAKALTVEQK